MKPLLLALAATAFAVSAPAAILTDASRNVRIVPSFWTAPQEVSNDTLLAFTEAENVRLPDGPFPVQVLNRWDHLEETAGLVVKDAVVDSHMLYFQMADSQERRTLVAEIEFDAPIIGLIADCTLFARDAHLFAPNPTHKQCLVYDNNNKLKRWSLEEHASWTPLDRVTVLSPTRLRIEFTNHSATDPLRVLTLRSGEANRPYAVPPATQP